MTVMPYSGLRTTAGKRLVTWSVANTVMRDWIVTHVPNYLPSTVRGLTRDQLHACLRDMLDRIAEIDDRWDYESQQCSAVVEGLLLALRTPGGVDYWEEQE